ncbi:putative ORF1 [Caledonia beadlet anemone Nora virus-like virus 1]|nr:putative ORF1 [Caledonia beadlet anemone Nora virus-like virus 1]
MSYDSDPIKSQDIRIPESDASAPKQEVDCASIIEGKINDNTVNNQEFFETDPWDCDSIPDENIDPVDAIFSPKNFMKEDVGKGPSVTMRRNAKIKNKNKKQKQEETQARLSEERERKRLEKLELIKQQGDQPVKSTKNGQRKVDVIKQKFNNTTVKDAKQIKHMELQPVYNDRRLYNDKSFDGDKVIPVKIIDEEVQDDYSEFKIYYHYLQRNQADDSSFTYGNTQIKKTVDVERSETKISKTKDKFNKRYLSKANFSFDLEGKPLLKQQKMNSNKNLVDDATQALQLPVPSSSPEPISQEWEPKIGSVFTTYYNQLKEINDETRVDETEEIVKQSYDFFISTSEDSAFSKISEVPDLELKGFYTYVTKIADLYNVNLFPRNNESNDSNSGASTVLNEIETMETIKEKEIVSSPSVCQEDQTLTALKQLSAQVASLTAALLKQSEELSSLRSELAEKDRQILALKEQPLPKVEVKEEIPQPSTSVDKKQQKVSDEKPSTSKEAPKMPPRAKTAPIKKFKDDGVNKLVNMAKAETPVQKMEVIKNNIILSEEQKKLAVNQEVRNVKAEKVNEKTFSEKLAANLVRSKSSVRWTPKIEAKSASPRPKGIQEKVWINILKQTPETLENWEAKRKLKIFDQYKKLFYAQHVKLSLQWTEAAIKAQTPKAKNDWLVTPGKILALLRKEDLDKVLPAIQSWRNSAATFVPKDGKISAGWAKTSSPQKQ